MTPRRILLGGLLLVILLAGPTSTPMLLSTESGSTLYPWPGDGSVVHLVRTENDLTRFEVGGEGVTFRFADLKGLDPEAHTLLIVAPTLGYGRGDVQTLRAFLEAGGRVIIADDGHVGHDLLQDLGAGVTTSAVPVYTPAFETHPHRIVTLSTGHVAGLPPEVIVSRPVAVHGGDPVLEAPDLVWLDLNTNGRPDLDEPREAGLAIAAATRVGAGELLVLGDPSALSRAAPEAAAAFAAYAAQGGRTLVVDEAHHAYSDPLATNALLAGRVHPIVGIGILICAATLVAVAVLGPRFRAEGRRRRLRTEGYDPHLLREVLAELDSK